MRKTSELFLRVVQYFYLKPSLQHLLHGWQGNPDASIVGTIKINHSSLMESISWQAISASGGTPALVLPDFHTDIVAIFATLLEVGSVRLEPWDVFEMGSLLKCLQVSFNIEVCVSPFIHILDILCRYV